MAIPSPEELEKLVEKMRALGVSRLETQELRLELGAKPAPPMARPSLEETEKTSARDKAWEEAMLFGSSEGFPEGWWTR